VVHPTFTNNNLVTDYKHYIYCGDSRLVLENSWESQHCNICLRRSEVTSHLMVNLPNDWNKHNERYAQLRYRLHLNNKNLSLLVLYGYTVSKYNRLYFSSIISNYFQFKQIYYCKQISRIVIANIVYIFTPNCSDFWYWSIYCSNTLAIFTIFTNITLYTLYLFLI
jgi:hypothetical protein